MQTFFIYTDNETHPLPADVASIPLVEIGGDDTIVAYAGAVWGEHDLSGREDYCIAWEVQPSNEFNAWLTGKGYRIKPEED